MANIDLSVIIPSKNNKNKTAQIIKKISVELCDLEVEFIVIDMNSSDNSVLSALNEIKNSNLRGYVIQSGTGTVASALNTGVHKSDGKYITFVYPGCLYKNYLKHYFDTMEKHGADFLYYSNQDESKDNEKVFFPSGEELFLKLVGSSAAIEFGAVMIRREFVCNNHISFYDDCAYGYAEAYIFELLLYSPNIVATSYHPERDYENSVIRDDVPVGNAAMGRVGAMIKVYEQMCLDRKRKSGLKEAFQYIKLPSVIMSAVDVLMEKNFSIKAIKNSLHTKHYDDYLHVSSLTPKKLRHKVLVWKYISGIYRV